MEKDIQYLKEDNKILEKELQSSKNYKKQLIMEIEQLKEELNNLENDYINKNNKLKE